MKPPGVRDLLLVGLVLAAALPGSAAAADAPLKLMRLDCGSLVEPTKPLPWRKANMPVGCYLVRHGDRYMLWDAGVSERALGDAHPTIKLARTLVDQLKQIGVRPEQVEVLGVSHYHGDHTGQAKAFPSARLVMGAEDLAALRRTPPPGGSAPSHLQPWLEGGAPLSALSEDHDVFGDGRVVVLMTRGHTPGHASLLVKLAARPVLIAGDLWATHDGVMTDSMPDFSSSFAETAASRERVRRLARELDALVILGHDVDDVLDLPPFPQWAE